MGRVKIFTILIMALSVISCSARPFLWSTGRSLLASHGVAGCTFGNWYPDMCQFNPQVVLSVNATDDRARLAQQVAAFDYTCSNITESVECGAKNNCAFSGGKCLFDLQHFDWNSFLACPDSKASRDAACVTVASDNVTCADITGCAWAVRTAEATSQLTQMVQQAFGASNPAATDSSAGNNIDTSGFSGPEGLCLPSGTTFLDYFKEAMQIGLASSGGPVYDYPATYWGSCAGSEVLKDFAQVCYSKTEDACNNNTACEWNPAGGCQLAPAGHMTLLFSSVPSIEALMSDCANTTGETECAAAGNAHNMSIDDSKISDFLAFQQTNAAVDVDINSTAEAGKNTTVNSAATSVTVAVQLLLFVAAAVMLMV